MIAEILSECSPIIFNGDGYSEEWHKEAEARGLLNLKSTADALPYLATPEVAEMFAKYGVLSDRELNSRLDTYQEQYCLSVDVEANLALSMAKTMIFPAAIRYQNELAGACANLKAVGYDFDTDTLDVITGLVKSLQDNIATLEHAIEDEKPSTSMEECRHRCDAVLPSMLKLRNSVDKLEKIVADDLWPLPTYQEMLFIK